jgi:anti-sigma regulatory factor (Ser/Thr protein kinase)
MTGSARLELPAAPESPRSARRFVTDQLGAWGYRSLAADAALLTSELVANAVRYATEPYAVEVVDLQDGVLVAVEDADHELPVRQHPGPESAGGRGLAIVESVAAAWGARDVPASGKLVWFRLAATPD